MNIIRNNYTLSSNLIFGSCIIGFVHFFIYDPESTTDFIIMACVLVLRYMLAILIKRRFEWSKYLVLVLIARSAYRFVYIFDNPQVNALAKINVFTQIVLAAIAFALLTFLPKMHAKREEKRRKANSLLNTHSPTSL